MLLFVSNRSKAANKALQVAVNRVKAVTAVDHLADRLLRPPFLDLNAVQCHGRPGPVGAIAAMDEDRDAVRVGNDLEKPSESFTLREKSAHGDGHAVDSAAPQQRFILFRPPQADDRPDSELLKFAHAAFLRLAAAVQVP